MSLLNSTDFHVREIGTLKGRGLFASRNFSRGESIYRFDYWSEPLMPMHVTNHSCDPNATFDLRGILIARCDIATDEEITFNYLAHPIPASPWNFECGCGAKACAGWIKATTDL